MEISSLVVGATYFRLTFADQDRTMPGLKPLVYLGELDKMESEERGNLAFQDSISYVRFGSRFEATEGIEEMEIVSIPSAELAASVLSVHEAASEVADAAQRATKLGNPLLSVVRTGWKAL